MVFNAFSGGGGGGGGKVYGQFYLLKVTYSDKYIKFSCKEGT
jgi:hypothetical protein